MPARIHVALAEWPDDLPAVRGLLEQYFHALACDPRVPASIRGKDRLAELDALPALYSSTTSPLLLAWSAGVLQGCVAVRMLPGRSHAAELKRLFVAPGARGSGLGRTLVLAAIDWARQRGAAELMLDTLPAAMAPAVHLYRALGFQPTDCYNQNHPADFAFFRLLL